MFFLEFASPRILVAENEMELRYEELRSAKVGTQPRKSTNLGTGTCQVGTEHDDPRRRVRKLLAARLETVLEQLEVSTTAYAQLLVLDLVLDHERIVFEVDRLLERSGYGVMGSLVFRHEALVAVDDRRQCVLDGPLTDVAESLTADGRLFRRL